MRVHHLNCATFCPLGGGLFWGPRCGFPRTRFICHCLLIEADAGLVLVDTGLGLADVTHPYRRLGLSYSLLMQPISDRLETAASQVESLGFQRDNVRDIILTHLDRDHAGGLPDFPGARVHVLEEEYRAATNGLARFARHRYQPSQWNHGPRWVRYGAGGEGWLGFEGVTPLDGLPPEILLVPMHGHTHGHCGVAVAIGGGWLLHAGDAYYHHGLFSGDSLWRRPGLALTQRLVEVDRAAAAHNRRRLRAIAGDHGSAVRIFCSHDPEELPVGDRQAVP